VVNNATATTFAISLNRFMIFTPLLGCELLLKLKKNNPLLEIAPPGWKEKTYKADSPGADGAPSLSHEAAPAQSWQIQAAGRATDHDIKAIAAIGELQAGSFLPGAGPGKPDSPMSDR
ncbi:MAG: hypothetical protein KDI64_07695, partial [Candidatus Accumulibacter sp.]|nr:hypothetical protein [Accumulibacter sp.]